MEFSGGGGDKKKSAHEYEPNFALVQIETRIWHVRYKQTENLGFGSLM